MNPKFEVKKKLGKHKFSLVTPDGVHVGRSESYETKQGCTNGIDSVRLNGKLYENYEKRIAKNKKLYFVLKAQNGEIILTGNMLKTEVDLDNAINSCATYSQSAEIVEA
ncbi:MAG: YegP family protein [Bacteroidota bacterium]